MADLDACESCVFLLEDPASFQEHDQVLRHLDGSLPEETETDWENCCLSWSQCPVLYAPWTLRLVPLLGLWYIAFLSQFLIYTQLEKELKVEETFRACESG